MTMSDHAVVWQGDLHKVYVDPLVGPRELLAYIPEQHASRRCERALKGGTDSARPDQNGPWCDMCTSPHRAAATVRRTLTGAWNAA